MEVVKKAFSRLKLTEKHHSIILFPEENICSKSELKFMILKTEVCKNNKN